MFVDGALSAATSVGRVGPLGSVEQAEVSALAKLEKGPSGEFRLDEGVVEGGAGGGNFCFEVAW